MTRNIIQDCRKFVNGFFGKTKEKTMRIGSAMRIALLYKIYGVLG